MATTKTRKKTPKKPPKKPPTPKPAPKKPSASEGAEAATLKKLCLRIRTTLSGLARADQMAEAKALYEAVYPETKQGGAAGKAGGGKAKNATVAGFVRYMSRETGLAPRTIAYDVEIATGILPEVKEKLAGTPLANATRDLIALTKLSKAQQKAVARKLVEGVAAARKQLKDWAPEPKAKSETLMIATCEVMQGKPAVIPFGSARLLITLLALDGGIARLEVCRASDEGATPIGLLGPGPDVDAQAPQVADADGDDTTDASSRSECAKEVDFATPDHFIGPDDAIGPDWARLATLPTQALSQADADAAFGTYVEAAAVSGVRLVIDDGSDARDLVYGDLAEFVNRSLSRSPGTAKKYARDAGLRLFGEVEPSPGLVVLIAYENTGAGIWPIGITRLDEAGEVPSEVYLAVSGPDHPDSNVAVRVAGSTPALGKVRGMWAVGGVLAASE